MTATDVQAPQPAPTAYSIQTVTDMLKVPAERRGAMLRELETALLTHELAFGDEAPNVAANMTWTDDGERSVDISANGKPLLKLKIEQKAGAVPSPEGADALDTVVRLIDDLLRYGRSTIEGAELSACIASLRAALAAQPQAAPAALMEAIDYALNQAPCDCPHAMRFERGEHLSGCYLFDLNTEYAKTAIKPAPAEAPEIGEVTWQQAADAIENLDDYARMMVGVDPSGPRETLYRFLEQAKTALASKVQPKGTAAELADVLRALLEQTFRGHTLADRLQFSTTGRELLRRADAAMAAAQSPAPAPEVLDGYKLVPLEPTPEMHEAYWTAARVPLSDAKFPAEVYRAMVAAAPAIKAPAVRDEPQDIGGHIRAAANARVAQQADDDTRRLDYLQTKQATISLVPDGRDEHGTRHSFMVGGWHCSVNRDVRASIDAAMGESHPPVQGSES